MFKRINGIYEYTLDVAQRWESSGNIQSFIIYCKGWVLVSDETNFSINLFSGDVQGGFASSEVLNVREEYYIYYVELNSQVAYNYIVLDGDDSRLIDFKAFDTALSESQRIRETERLLNLASPNPPVRGFEPFDDGTELNFNDKLQYPVAQDLPKHIYEPGSGSGEIVEADSTSQLPVGTKTFRFLENYSSKIFANDAAYGEFTFKNMKMVSFVTIRLMDGIGLRGYILSAGLGDFTLSRQTNATNTNLLNTYSVPALYDTGDYIDVKLIRKTDGEFTLYYRLSGSREWILVQSPVVDNVYQESVKTGIGSDTNVEFGEIKIIKY